MRDVTEFFTRLGDCYDKIQRKIYQYCDESDTLLLHRYTIYNDIYEKKTYGQHLCRLGHRNRWI